MDVRMAAIAIAHTHLGLMRASPPLDMLCLVALHVPPGQSIVSSSPCRLPGHVRGSTSRGDHAYDSAPRRRALCLASYYEIEGPGSKYSLKTSVSPNAEERVNNFLVD